MTETNTAAYALSADVAIAPIRTPDDYLAAIDIAFQALSDAAFAHRSCATDADRLAQRAELLSTAVSESPFRMCGSEVVARGFFPKLVL